MPEMTFTVEWPDGSLQDCYSPSLVMHDFLSVGESYSVPEFVRLTSNALDQASERVRAKFGFACTSAAEQREAIHDKAQAFPEGAGAAGAAGASKLVRVLAMEPPLPAVNPDAASPVQTDLVQKGPRS